MPLPGHSAANAALVSFRLLQLIPKNPPLHSLKRPQMLSTLLDTLPHFLWILLSSLGMPPVSPVSSPFDLSPVTPSAVKTF